MSYVHCDARCKSDVNRAVETAISLHGKLDIMFNNVGIGDPSSSSILDEDDTTTMFERVMGVNVLVALLGTKHAGRAMVAAGRRRKHHNHGELGVSGRSAGSPDVLVLVARCVGASALAELGKNEVRVNCVSLSVVATLLTVSHYQASEEELEALGEVISTLKRVMLKAKDIVEAVPFLASDESRFALK
ncbi:hypothetical protein ZIOFF_001032 [Zingiber officinale]|uniref:Uncharacterized protein n=1 Tax=Zingiber officinale TaxID=94328 RepID=A0A8J5M720_ZINOF|nr:hypothetical protein ZIOFF_001032 [Zingiber officinale]